MLIFQNLFGLSKASSGNYAVIKTSMVSVFGWGRASVLRTNFSVPRCPLS